MVGLKICCGVGLCLGVGNGWVLKTGMHCRDEEMQEMYLLQLTNSFFVGLGALLAGERNL